MKSPPFGGLFSWGEQFGGRFGEHLTGGIVLDLMDADAERIELLLGAGGQVTVFISFIAAKIAPVQRVSIAVIQEQRVRLSLLTK